MIAYLSGKIVGHLENQIILRLPSGIGYLINVPTSSRYMINENVDLYIWEVKRDDKDELYGFTDLENRLWSERLTKVSGVGPKMGASIIYTLGFERVIEAINSNDAEVLETVKGLGGKTAKKIIIELKNSNPDVEILSKLENNSEMVKNFTDALSNLGYKRGEIVSTISKLKKQGDWNEHDLVYTVKKGLEIIGKR